MIRNDFALDNMACMNHVTLACHIAQQTDE